MRCQSSMGSEEDDEFLSFQEWLRDALLRHFGVPSALLGQTRDINRAMAMCQEMTYVQQRTTRTGQTLARRDDNARR